MKKSIIVVLFIMSILLANAAENGSVEYNSLGNASDLPVTSAEAVANEIQAGNISIAEGVEDAAEIPSTNAINQAIDSGINSSVAPLTGKKQVTASFGVYLEIVG